MQTKNPTTVLAVRVPTELSDDVRRVAKARNLSVNEMLRMDIAARYYCGSNERISDESDQTSDADSIELGD